ncbi:AraC family transcriptional regulator [Aquitalea sp. FJL05]|jgi:AraC family transcriptional regulator, ethanolamine operon transcriptional activator|uniref:helix-turn-helix domain-containing protein n=1 Tax=Aquitalea TaxID=407217 RepID=UPI000F5921D3|nr:MULTISPECIES: helix-turn-helix domain-containing protein [Aquitalea]RQO73636.1 AraC family transcriptional regulator [Aquitalea sp. FJL05]
MLAEIRHFNDAQHHAAHLPGWQQVYDQISSGRFCSSLSRLHTGHLEVFREVLNQRVVQYGRAPADMVHFAIPIHAPLPLTLQGRSVGSHAITALRSNEEFIMHVPPAVDSIQLSVRNEDLAALAPEFYQQLSGKRHWQPVIQVRPEQLASTRSTLLGVFEQALENPDLLEFAGSQKLVQHQLISLLLDMLHDSVPEQRLNLTYATHSDIVRRSQAIVMDSSDEPVTVLDLCQQLRVSRRTLQNSFQLIANTTPVDYLRSIRLNAVRRMLLSPEHAARGIREAAGYWGFYHLGHFARDYRKLFCELPSDTRSRGLLQ